MNRYYFIEATNNETGKVQYIQAADRETAFNGLEFICVRAEARGRLYEIKETAGNVAVTVSAPDSSRSVTYCVVVLAECKRAAAARILANLRSSNEMSYKMQIGFGMIPARRSCSYTVTWDGNQTAPSIEETRALLQAIAEAPEATTEAAEDNSTTDTTGSAQKGAKVAQFARRAAELIGSAARRAGGAILRGSRHLAAVAALVLVGVLSFSVFFLALNGAAAGLDLVGLEGWPRLVLVVVLALSVCLDLAIWAELNALAIVGRSHVCDIWQSSTADRLKFQPVPFSVWFKIWKECRQ